MADGLTVGGIRMDHPVRHVLLHRLLLGAVRTARSARRLRTIRPKSPDAVPAVCMNVCTKDNKQGLPSGNPYYSSDQLIDTVGVPTLPV